PISPPLSLHHTAPTALYTLSLHDALPFSITRLNPDMSLPALPIHVFHRNDGKGSNYILSDYLCKVSPEFLAIAVRGESPKWPVGDRKSTRLNSSHVSISYAVCCLKKKNPP